MSEHFPELKSSITTVKVQLNISDYATKEDLRNVTGVDVSDFAEIAGLANLKSDDKLDIDKLKNAQNALNKLKSKLETTPVSNVVKKWCY